MLLEERERMIEELISDEFSTREELTNVSDEDLIIYYNSCYEKEAEVDEVDQKDEVQELIIQVQETLTDYFTTDLPEWIVNIPDEQIKQLAIDKYKVTPEQIFEIVEKLRRTYEQR